MALHPQDLLILYKRIANTEQSASLAALARELHMSLSQVHRSVARCIDAGLATASDKGPIQPIHAALHEFAVHGVRYAFAAKLGPPQRGIPTSFGAPPLSEEIRSSKNEIPVWPHPEGTARGPSVEPLSRYAPMAALADSALHELLALQDALRIGRARERKLAADYLADRLGVAHGHA